MLDYRKQLEDAVWARLEACDEFRAAVTVGKRIKMAAPSGRLRELILRTPADFPSVKVELRGGPVNQESPPRVYSSAAYAIEEVDQAVLINQRVAVIVTYDPEHQLTSDQTPLESAIDKALWSGWPTFGLAYVNQSRWSSTRGQLKAETRIHPQTTFVIDFVLMPMMSQIAG